MVVTICLDAACEEIRGDEARQEFLHGEYYDGRSFYKGRFMLLAGFWKTYGVHNHSELANAFVPSIVLRSRLFLFKTLVAAPLPF